MEDVDDNQVSADVEVHHGAVGGLLGEYGVDGGHAGEEHRLHYDAAVSECCYPLKT